MKTYEAKGKSLAEAKKIIESKLDNGDDIVQQETISDGKKESVTYKGDTVEAAFTVAKSQIPSDAEIKDEITLSDSSTTTLELNAFNEADIKELVPSGDKILSISKIQSGKKGFLGIGKTPHSYKVDILTPAKVEVIFCKMVHIRASVITAAEKSDEDMLSKLRKLCDLYRDETEHPTRFRTDSRSEAIYSQIVKDRNHYEEIATEIGKKLNSKGGLSEMRRIFDMLDGIRGTRTLEMHWGGIGIWRS